MLKTVKILKKLGFSLLEFIFKIFSKLLQKRIQYRYLYKLNFKRRVCKSYDTNYAQSCEIVFEPVCCIKTKLQYVAYSMNILKLCPYDV